MKIPLPLNALGKRVHGKGAAKIIPGSSLGGFRAVGAAGIASRGAASLRTRYDIQKTRENAKEKVEQAAQEKQVKDRFVVHIELRRSNSLRGGMNGGKDRG